jgi:hypothetical protein
MLTHYHNERTGNAWLEVQDIAECEFWSAYTVGVMTGIARILVCMYMSLSL